jgi:hypothetical protein
LRKPRITLLVLFLSALLLPSGVRAGSSTAHFPTITSYNLAKTKITLPAAFSANRVLLFISFDVGDTPQLDHWVSAAQSLSQPRGNLDFYLLPISAPKNPVYRWWDNAAMRSDFADSSLWPRIVPLYLNETRFRSRLQIPSTSEFVVLLTDRNGNVLWRTDGKPDSQKLQALRTQLHS